MLRALRMQTETQRIQRHIHGAELVAHARDVRGLHVAQQHARALLLAELALYREAGIFPENPDFDEPMPYFIDAHGTRCAMAHLMEIGGAGPLVAEIAATRNNAFVAELADDPRVLAWLAAAGISPEEAARIQPSYCPSTPADCVCNNGGNVKVNHIVVRGTQIRNDRMKVTAIAGKGEGPCANIKVGDTLPLGGDYYNSTESVTAVAAADSTGGICGAQLLHVATSEAHLCNNGLADTKLPADLSPEDTLAALDAADCKSALAAKDSAWSAPPANSCSGESKEGCNASGAIAFDGFTTAAVLAAILAYRAARGRR